MNAGIAAYVILAQNTDVTDIVGVNIFPEVAEQETATPFIVYQLQSVAPEDTHDGPSKLDEVRFEFLCYADSYALAADLGDKVRGALDRVSGTYNGVNVESIQFNDVDIDTIDAPRRFAQVLTFTFRIKRDNFTIAQGTPVTGAMLGDLYDVDTTGVSDGQVIAYDADSQEWQPADGGGGVTELGQLTDVQFEQGGPEDGNVLFYDGDIWTNDTLQKSQIGLANVDNTSDANKPVSSATQTELNAKANSADFSNVDNTSDADKPVSTDTQTALNAKANSADFSNVDNTSDANKPVSTATQTALNAKANSDDFSNVDNTSDANKPVSTATQTALNAKANSADFSNVDNTSDADKPVSTATQTALNAKADTSAVPTDLNDLSDVTIAGTPVGNQALIYDATAGAFKSLASYTNRFEDEVETGLQMPDVYFERGYSVKSEGDGIFIDASSDTPAAGKVIVRKIYHKTGFISGDDVIGDYTLIHTFADDTAYADTVAVFDAFEDGATYGVPPFTLVQSWEEEDAAPSFVGLLNETYGSGAEAAYSTRRLNGNVTECMVIRRASDSTTTTIGFDGSGNIDESAITTFCTGTTCTVSEWKDQSGNGNDATQSTASAEPDIYTSGSIVKQENRAALHFFGETLYAGLLSSQTATFFSVINPNNGNSQWIFNFDTDNSPALRSGGTYSSFTPFVDNNSYTGTYKTGDFFQRILVRGESFASQTSPLFKINSRNTNDSPANAGKNHIQEAIIYSAVKSASDTISIEENIGAYYTQNTPLLDTYSGAEAAYSLRKLRTAYTGDAVEVYNGSSYADIGFNVFGELDTVALADHCGSNNGFIRTWYDQAGSNDATQSTTSQMPKIYDGTNGVILENGKPAAYFNGDPNSLHSSASISHTNSTMIVVCSVDNVSHGTYDPTVFRLGDGATKDNDLRFMYGTSNRSNVIFRREQNTVVNTLSYTNSSMLNQNLTFNVVSSSNLESFMNGSSQGTQANTPTAMSSSSVDIGAVVDGTANVEIHAKIQEAIFYTVDQDSAGNRTNIESNINTFYDIF